MGGKRIGKKKGEKEFQFSDVLPRVASYEMAARRGERRKKGERKGG